MLDFTNMMDKLIDKLVADGKLKTPVIIQAWRQIDRVDFVAEDQKLHAYEDRPLSIGFGQTISQPTTVAFMLELLDPRPGQKILDVGTGSAWQSALLGQIVGESGKVYGVERIETLRALGQSRLKRAGVKNVEINLAVNPVGWPAEAPYDRIICAAAASEAPRELLAQLKIKGKAVLPINNSIFYFERKTKDDFISREYPGFMFVPLISR